MKLFLLKVGETVLHTGQTHPFGVCVMVSQQGLQKECRHCSKVCGSVIVSLQPAHVNMSSTGYDDCKKTIIDKICSDFIILLICLFQKYLN